MFDIGFWELAFIGVIALLVIGPERLPKVARTAGLWVGKARAIVSSVKADIDRELAAEELKKTLDKQQLSNPIHEIIEETQSIANDTRKALDESKHALDDAVNEPVKTADPETTDEPPRGKSE